MWDIDFNRLRDVFVYDPQAPMIFSSGIFLWLFAAFILVALMEIIKSHKWRTDNSGNLIANIFLHLFLPVAIVIAPIVGGIPYWVIKDYVPDLFIVSCLSVVLLAIGGILKLKNRRNS